MKTSKQKANNSKRVYSRPSVERIKLDKEISIMMASFPPDPGGSVEPEHFSINPFKMPKL